MLSYLLNNAITINTEIQHGKPVLRGTRIPIAIIIGSLAGGMSYEEVIEEYAVTQEQIQQVLEQFIDRVDMSEIVGATVIVDKNKFRTKKSIT